MRMKFRKSMLFLMLVTVLAPIVLFTDTLGFYFPSSSFRNELVEDASTFTFAGEVKPLYALPQESSTTPKEPQGTVYSDNSIESHSNDADVSSGGTSRVTRQLTGEEDITKKVSNLRISGDNKLSSDENPIREVIDMMQQNGVETGKVKSNEPKMNKNIGIDQNGAKKDLTSQHREGASEILKEKMETKTSERTLDISGNQDKPISEKQNEQTAMSDARVRKIRDLLIQGRVYLSLAAIRNHPQLIRDLRQRIKEATQALGSATNDSELPRNANDKMKALEQILGKVKQIQDDCASVVKKLRAMLHSTEEQIRANKKQALFLTHLTAKTIPKGLHCLPLRLSTEYFTLNSSQRHFLKKEALEDPKLFHYALFSDNIMAAAVVVNSTITHAKDPAKHVFHVVTDRLNFAPMKMWFLANSPAKATINVQNVEEFTWLNASYSPVLKQLGSANMIDYYFKSRRAESDPNLKYRNPKYLSIMNHLRFYLPEIFPYLDKVLFLDDDIVVQKDLTPLWSIDLKNKVIGVVETCGESFHRFDRYLNFSNPIISKSFDPRACGWAFGMNIFDLKEWRRQNITDVYHKWQNLNHDRLLWKLGTLPPGLITFWNHTFRLHKSWHVLGLGYNPNVPQKDIERAAVIHYNGNLKPWLEIAIPKFRNYWTKYVDYDQNYLRECNITP